MFNKNRAFLYDKTQYKTGNISEADFLEMLFQHFFCIFTRYKSIENNFMEAVKIEHLSPLQLKEKGINSWPIWEKESSRFDWHYEATEECFILEGEVLVETAEGNFEIKAGDFVTFRKGLDCVWEIKKDIRKHYNFI